ncbi:MAG: transposase [Acidobacteria bacterium]|nr:transposase [Acidobacteriota bacterium]
MVCVSRRRPVEDSTGERQRIGSISKQGSRLLRFLLVEAGQVAVRRDQDLSRVYRRVLLRRGHATAKVAVGRRLLVRAFKLRDEIDYPEFQRRGVAARSSRRPRRL